MRSFTQSDEKLIAAVVQVARLDDEVRTERSDALELSRCRIAGMFEPMAMLAW